MISQPTRKTVWLVIGALLVLASVAAAFAIMPKQPTMFQKSYSERSAKWMHWLDNQDFQPLTASGDVACTLGQEGHVWFLPVLKGMRSNGPVSCQPRKSCCSPLVLQ